MIQKNRLLTDKKTGFLTTANGSVTAQQKVDFLEAFKKTGNVRKSCEIAGISGHLIRKHRELDKNFGEAYLAIREDLCDEVEGCLYYAATHSKNVTAMFGFLRAHRSQIYGDKRTIEHKETKTERVKTLLNKMKAEGQLIDLEATAE